MHSALHRLGFGQARVLGHMEDLERLGQIVQLPDRYRLSDVLVWVLCRVSPQVLRLGVRLDKQVAGDVLDFLHHGPVVLLVLRVLAFVRSRADQGHHIGAQVTRCPNGAKGRVRKVGAATGVRNLGNINQRGQLAGLGVDRSDLVGGVGCHQEVALGSIPAAVVQELGGTDGGGLQVFDIGIIDHQDLAGFLDVDHPFRLDEGRNDGSHTGLGMVLTVHGHATGRNHLQRLQRVAFHDGVLRWPVAAGNCILVFKALELGGINRTCIECNLDFSHDGGLFHPQVDQRDPAIATNHVNVTARSGQTGDMDCIASLDNTADFLGIAVNQSNFTGVTQRDREDVVQVELVHLLGRTLVDRHDDLPGIQLILEAVLWRHIRRVLDVACHQVDFFLGQDVIKVHHAAIGTVTDDLFQTRLTQGQRTTFSGLAFLVGHAPMRLKVLAGGTLAQDTVATSATLEVNLLGCLFFSGRHGGRLRFVLSHCRNCKARQHHHCSDARKAGKCHRSYSIGTLQPIRLEAAFKTR